MTADAYRLNDLLAYAIRCMPAASENFPWSICDVNKVDDLEALTGNVAHSSLRTDDPEMRRYLEAKVCLLARASAGGAENSIVDGEIRLGDDRRYFLANLHFGELVLECGDTAFVAIKPGWKGNPPPENSDAPATTSPSRDG